MARSQSPGKAQQFKIVFREPRADLGERCDPGPNSDTSKAGEDEWRRLFAVNAV